MALTDTQLIKRASDYLIKIKSGINPITENKIEDCVSLFQEERILKCFEYSAKYLIDYCNLLEAVRNSQEKTIFLSSDKIHITKSLDNSRELVGSSSIASYLNHSKIYSATSVKSTDILVGLLKLGFVKDASGCKGYTVTEKGLCIGLLPRVFVSSKKNGISDTYPVFSLKAQQYVLEHLSEILPDWKITILNA